MPRGILATVTAVPAGARRRPARGARRRRTPTRRSCTSCPRARWPHTAATLGSNSCHLQATVDVDSGRLIVVSAIDNLGKGAAGQAVQCANLMFGLPETTGLSRRSGTVTGGTVISGEETHMSVTAPRGSGPPVSPPG